ncbi:magnetosome-associated protein MamJ [Amyelois transitella]|uniref:magnetosome-associated protein MamJ n=1 Tax=Amyelois transitella TaxID=680683 RepID=UPI0029900E2E|nr:magnetosome-associated protein MamJ [Amyelois transitella]
MKFLLLTLFVAFVASAPVEDAGNPVEVVVNGLPEGQALDIGDIVDIKLKEHVDGQVAASTDLLHPFSAAGIAEAVAAAEVEAHPVQVVENAENEVDPVQVIETEVEPIQTLPIVIENEVAPSPIVVPLPIAPEVVPGPETSPVLPEVAPEPIILPEAPVAPEVVPSPIVLPELVAPEVVPSPVVIPEPVVPEVPDISESLPAPAQQFGEIYNDGAVQVTVNGPEDAGIMSTLQSWLNVVMNYFNNGAQTTQQIV